MRGGTRLRRNPGEEEPARDETHAVFSANGARSLSPAHRAGFFATCGGGLKGR
jgi:hypothetical protein